MKGGWGGGGPVVVEVEIVMAGKAGRAWSACDLLTGYRVVVSIPENPRGQ